MSVCINIVLGVMWNEEKQGEGRRWRWSVRKWLNKEERRGEKKKRGNTDKTSMKEDDHVEGERTGTGD